VRDVGRLCSKGSNPFLHRLGDELRPVVRTHVLRHAPQDEQIGQNVDHIRRFELADDPDRQALMRELVDNVQHPILPAIVGMVLDEVIGPDMIGPLSPQTDARSVINQWIKQSNHDRPHHTPGMRPPVP